MQQEGPAVSGVQQNPGGPRSAAMPPPMGSHPGPNGNRGGPILPFEYGPDAGPYRDQVEVSQELVPMVIGKRGATISTMKQQTGANIYVVTGSDIGDQSTREQGYSIFFVDAQTEEQLQAAVDAIREKVSPLEPKEGEIQKFFEIPDHKVPEVLGPQGIALARIKERSGARLEIKAILPTDYHGPAKNMPRTVNCVGTEEAVSKCEELVNKVVSGTVTCADLISEYEVGHPEVRSQKRLSSSLPYDDTKRRRMDYGEYQGGYDSSYNAGYQRGGGPPGGGYGGRGPMKGGGKGGWSESPADSCMLEVPSSGVGAIIGRGGEIINQLKEDGRCDIQISKSGGPYREVSIQGPYDGILTVVGFINERLAGAHTVKSMPANGLPPYLFGSGGGPSGPGMAPRGGPPMSGGPGRMGGGPRPYMQQSSPPPRSYGGPPLSGGGMQGGSPQGYSTPPAPQPWQQQPQGGGPVGGYGGGNSMMPQQQPQPAQHSGGPSGPGGYYSQQYGGGYQQHQAPAQQPGQGYMPPQQTAPSPQQSPYQYQSPVPTGGPLPAGTPQAAGPSQSARAQGGSGEASSAYASAYLAAAWQQYYASLHRQQAASRPPQ